MSATSGKVALANQATGIGCNGGSIACTDAQAAHIIDLVGYGSANFFEGSPATGTGGNDESIQRKQSGNQDTDVNSDDFESRRATAPPPRSAAAPLPARSIMSVCRAAAPWSAAAS